MPSERFEPRYAVYLTPAEPWYTVGNEWLDAGAIDRAAWTAAPRHYGLHATLKPPFRLAIGHTLQQLDDALRALAVSCGPFNVALELKKLREFLAWCPVNGQAALPALTKLADSCVAHLDIFRAPSSMNELARRRRATLTPAQANNLSRWGYPYVFDTFVFHITLTGQLEPAALEAAEKLLQIRTPTDMMAVRAISLYVQPAEDAPFIVARDYCFDGAVRDGVGAVCLSIVADKRNE